MTFNFNKDFLQEFSENVFLDVLWSNPFFHPKLNKILGYYLHDLSSSRSVFINISHSDLPTNSLEEIDVIILQKFEKIITISEKKSLKFHNLNSTKIYDLQIANGEQYQFEKMNFLNVPKKYYHSKRFFQYIPITKHIEYLQYKFQTIQDKIDLQEIKFSQFKEDYVEAFYKLEINEISVSNFVLDSKYQKLMKSSCINDLGLLTSYNLYNPSLRPTINFQNINLLNLSKNDNSRELIISRNGYLFEYDYKGFHLSILCKLLKYELKYGDVYTELFNEIHNTDYLELNDSQHELIKNEFFQIFFSESLESKYESKFLEKIFGFKKYLLNYFETNGFIKSPFTKEIYYHESFSTKNIFSIFFRICETELNVKTLLNIQGYLEDKLTKLIFYQFDSFIIDWDKDDGKQVLKDLKNIIETEDSYNISIAFGKNFNAMKQIK